MGSPVAGGEAGRPPPPPTPFRVGSLWVPGPRASSDSGAQTRELRLQQGRCTISAPAVCGRFQGFTETGH